MRIYKVSLNPITDAPNPFIIPRTHVDVTKSYGRLMHTN